MHAPPLHRSPIPQQQYHSADDDNNEGEEEEDNEGEDEDDEYYDDEDEDENDEYGDEDPYDEMAVLSQRSWPEDGDHYYYERQFWPEQITLSEEYQRSASATHLSTESELIQHQTHRNSTSAHEHYRRNYRQDEDRNSEDRQNISSSNESMYSQAVHTLHHVAALAAEKFQKVSKRSTQLLGFTYSPEYSSSEFTTYFSHYNNQRQEAANNKGVFAKCVFTFIVIQFVYETYISLSQCTQSLSTTTTDSPISCISLLREHESHSIHDQQCDDGRSNHHSNCLSYFQLLRECMNSKLLVICSLRVFSWTSQNLRNYLSVQSSLRMVNSMAVVLFLLLLLSRSSVQKHTAVKVKEEQQLNEMILSIILPIAVVHVSFTSVPQKIILSVIPLFYTNATNLWHPAITACIYFIIFIASTTRILQTHMRSRELFLTQKYNKIIESKKTMMDLVRSTAQTKGKNAHYSKNLSIILNNTVQLINEKSRYIKEKHEELLLNRKQLISRLVNTLSFIFPRQDNNPVLKSDAKLIN